MLALVLTMKEVCIRCQSLDSSLINGYIITNNIEVIKPTLCIFGIICEVISNLEYNQMKYFGI